ncbi:MAG TPA: cytochrome-c oxidase, cbb3-type subunit II [Candidatus Methylomirabilis sp.]|nr:cytochrome-c oxidase, cbb3-type subunit II [Candidatus Methylomirabilis sp.]
MRIDSLYEKPVLFALAAVVVISVGTLVTTFIPLFLPSTQPVSPLVKPYTAVETEGRDIYLREGCNNCHTQTVRPLRTEVARYGDYSKPEESAWDRPFLWGSRRTGPDLARVGGKYPDAWHYRHMANPQGMFETSNMPAYPWLGKAKLDTSLTARKVKVLGYGYDGAEVDRQIAAFRRTVTAPDYPSAQVRAQVTPEPLRGELTELDALVAYMQRLGKDLKAAQKTAAVAAPDAAAGEKNPYAGNHGAEEEGEKIFKENCRSCHGEKGGGGFGPKLASTKHKYGGSDTELFASVAAGRPGGMPAFLPQLGKDRVWKTVAYLRHLEKEGR